MGVEATKQNQDLESAFQTFNEMSESLAASYQMLQGRVTRLTEELAAARSERLTQLAEKELLADRLANLLNALPGGVVVLDAGGRIQAFNPGANKLFRDLSVGGRWHDLVGRHLVHGASQAHEYELADGRRVSVSTRRLERDGGSIVLLTDVTETRALQDRVNRAQRLSSMGEMAAGLAHQIRTPISSALLYASHLAQGDTMPVDQRRFAERIASRLRHMEHQVNDMLSFARGGEGRTDTISIQDLFDDLEKSLEIPVQAGDAMLHIEDHSNGHRIDGNSTALLGALSNLAMNAIQAASGPVKLTLKAQVSAGQTLNLVFSDDGPGIAPEKAERIFEPFYTTRPDGTGLGLAVVRSVFQAHGGDIELVRGTSCGARFSMTLPFATTATPMHSEVGAARAHSGSDV